MQTTVGLPACTWVDPGIWALAPFMRQDMLDGPRVGMMKPSAALAKSKP